MIFRLNVIRKRLKADSATKSDRNAYSKLLMDIVTSYKEKYYKFIPDGEVRELLRSKKHELDQKKKL